MGADLFCWSDISVVSPIPPAPIVRYGRHYRRQTVAWAVSAHPYPISSNLRDSILTHF